MTTRATPKMSRVSKLDGIRSWSLEAVVTCPGSHAKLTDPEASPGVLVAACRGCYAVGGNYRFKNVKEPRQHNRQDWQHPDWVDAMCVELDNDRYFRWFDSGDVYHPQLAEKIFQVIQRTPWVKHWLPTRSHKVPKIRPILERIAELPNVAVRYSSDEIDAWEPHHGSVVIAEDSTPDGVTICHAYDRGGKCGGCRACWNKDIPVIGYVGHGRAMEKVIKIHKAS